jgi:NDP-sugar pyrophosphorylase family protein
MDALVTAGGPMPDTLRPITDRPYKCELELGGRRIIDRCLEALHAAEHIERVCLVGPPALRDTVDLGADDLWIDERGSGTGNLMVGLEALADREQILFCASDMPFVTAAGFDDMVRRTPAGAGFVVPIYRREDIEAALPESSNKYVPFKEGALTASSSFILGPRLLAAHAERVETLFHFRKHFLRIFAMIGPGTALRFMLAMKFGWRVLSVPMLEAKISRMLGFPCRALFGCDAAFNFDIDHERDYAEAVQALARQTGGSCSS